MATNFTVTVTVDDGAISGADAGQIGNKIEEIIHRQFQNDTRITAITPTHAAASITLAIT